MTIKELRQIHADGTKGKWSWRRNKLYGGTIDGFAGIKSGDDFILRTSSFNRTPYVTVEDQDAALIVTARNMLPKLLDIIEMQREALEALIGRAGYMAEVNRLTQLGRHIDALIEVDWSENMLEVNKARQALAQSDKLLGDK